MKGINIGSNFDNQLKKARSVRGLNKINIMSPREDINNMMDTLYDDAIKLSASAKIRAVVYKTINNICNLVIMLVGAIISALGFTVANDTSANNTTIANTSSSMISYVIAILGVAITLINGINTYFAFGKRSVAYKENSIKLKKIARNVKIMKNTSKSSTTDILKQIDLLYADIDVIDISLFVGYAEDKVATGDPNDLPDDVRENNALPNDIVVNIK
jgi:hypothetical protein